MDKIQHKFIDIRGLKLHVAEIGNTGGPVVVFLHGFPEIWYSWRHQMIAAADAGIRAIAPDYRGYGLSEVPAEPQKTTFKDLLEDLLAILDFFSISKAFIVGKDFGTRTAYFFALLHPERVSGIATLGAPYVPPGASLSSRHVSEGLYISRWQTPERAEADFERFDTKTVIRNIYILFSGAELPMAEEGKEVMDLVDQGTPLPYWFTEEDLRTYAEHYKKSGFLTPMQVPYRSLRESIDVRNVVVEVPALLIMGGKDYTLKFPGMEEYLNEKKAKDYVPNLETVFLDEGTHFVQEQFPDQANRLLIAFFNKCQTT